MFNMRCCLGHTFKLTRRCQNGPKSSIDIVQEVLGADPLNPDQEGRFRVSGGYLPNLAPGPVTKEQGQACPN